MGTDTTEYYRCSCEQDVVESEQLAHENWCPGKPPGLSWQGADNAPLDGNTSPQEEVPVMLAWRRLASGNYYAEYRPLGAACLVGKLSESGARRWFVEVWPAALPGAKQYVRAEYGLKTMAEARALAVSTPCFRCGRGRPLILMERYPPRWRCLDHRTCEAERKRLLDDVAKSAAIETDARTELAGLN